MNPNDVSQMPTDGKQPADSTPIPAERIQLPTGSFTLEELTLLFDNLPAEISFIDKDDTVRFFNTRPTGFFSRPKAALGRNMRVCHPKRLLPMIEQLLDDFKSGRQDKALFWRSNHNGSFISIAYYALRNEKGEYTGTLEVVQDISELKRLEGDRNDLVYP